MSGPSSGSVTGGAARAYGVAGAEPLRGMGPRLMAAEPVSGPSSGSVTGGAARAYGVAGAEPLRGMGPRLMAAEPT